MKKFSRRVALRGLGGLLVSAPLLEGCSSLEGLWSAPARQRLDADEETPRARRFIAMMCPNGVEPAFWYPPGDGPSLEFNVQNQPLEAIREHLILTRGIANQVAVDHSWNGHVEGVQSMLTGFPVDEVESGGNDFRCLGGPSVDVAISRHQAEQGYTGRVAGIHLGEEVPGPYSSIGIGSDGERLSYTKDLSLLFDSPGDESLQAMERARMNRRSVLDGSLEDYRRLASRVSGEDRLRVEAHLDAVRSIERRLGAAPSCSLPEFPRAEDDDERRDLFQDIIVAAFACDAARTATLCFRHSGGGGPSLPFIDVLEDIHELSHQIVGSPPDHPSHQKFTDYLRWWSRKTVRFVERLKDTPTAEGGTLFDDVVIFQGSEIGWDHATPEVPFLLVAGPETPFDTGRYLRFSPRVMHTHLLVTLLHAFGLEEVEQVGDPLYVEGNLDGHFFTAG